MAAAARSSTRTSTRFTDVSLVDPEPGLQRPEGKPEADERGEPEHGPGDRSEPFGRGDPMGGDQNRGGEQAAVDVVQPLGPVGFGAPSRDVEVAPDQHLDADNDLQG